jgi:hypothetical protein
VDWEEFASSLPPPAPQRKSYHELKTRQRVMVLLPSQKANTDGEIEQARLQDEREFQEAAQVFADQKAKWEKLKDLSRRVLAGEHKAYIISNIGSFGEGIYKIGLTRRLDPQERIDELGHAGVPFEFDIHGLIESENAPALEHKIHKQLLAMQVNKMNFRKEFFRVSLADIHLEMDKLKQGEDFVIKTWTEKAIAQEFKDSIEIENDPQKKEKWLARQKAMTDRQLRFDLMRINLPASSDTDEDNETN